MRRSSFDRAMDDMGARLAAHYEQQRRERLEAEEAERRALAEAEEAERRRIDQQAREELERKIAEDRRAQEKPFENSLRL